MTRSFIDNETWALPQSWFEEPDGHRQTSPTTTDEPDHGTDGDGHESRD